MRIEKRGASSPSATFITLGNTELLFSYDTLVAFKTGHRWIVSENVWGTTTGKHLNYVSANADRLPRADFLELLEQMLARFNEDPTREVFSD